MPIFVKLSTVAWPKRSLPTLATITHVRTAQARSDRLIRALAAKAQMKLFPNRVSPGAETYH